MISYRTAFTMVTSLPTMTVQPWVWKCEVIILEKKKKKETVLASPSKEKEKEFWQQLTF